jgi:hypothetical protein
MVIWARIYTTQKCVFDMSVAGFHVRESFAIKEQKQSINIESKRLTM